MIWDIVMEVRMFYFIFLFSRGSPLLSSLLFLLAYILRYSCMTIDRPSQQRENRATFRLFSAFLPRRSVLFL